MSKKPRCEWAGDDPLMQAYHDSEWGVPVHDDRRLFELLTLEGAQAGLSWATILKKRENYLHAFEHFDPVRVSRFSSQKINALLKNPGIVRNRLKLESVISNAHAILKIQNESGTFDAYIWEFVKGRPIQNNWQHLHDIPTETAESRQMSRDLKKNGFRFVGPTICYAFMQATGMVNDHTVTCYRHRELKSETSQK